jgi:hypothetical protein
MHTGYDASRENRTATRIARAGPGSHSFKHHSAVETQAQEANFAQKEKKTVRNRGFQRGQTIGTAALVRNWCPAMML